MELSCVQIAKLVLGYLKVEKCNSAYTEFLGSCRHLREAKKRKQYKATRVWGLGLTDIIKEYCRIQRIVQERLEDTEFFDNESHSKKLVHQLLYLLDQGAHRSPPSPNFMSRCSTPIEDCTCNKHMDLEHVNVTPLNSLPGHTANSLRPVKDRRSSSAPSRDSVESHRNTETEVDCSKDDEDDVGARNESTHMAVQAFANSLLQQQELQEKLAESINQARHSDVNEGESDGFGAEVIDEAIKTVVARTESDPAFDSLFASILGNLSRDGNKQHEIQQDCDKEDTPKSADTPAQSEQIVSVEEQNDAAINSIISTVQKMETAPAVESFQQAPSSMPDINQKLTINTNNGDVILYDGSFDSYMRNGSVSTTPVAQPMILNQPAGLLMMKPQPNTGNPARNVDTKPFFVLNGSHLVNVTSQPQTQFILSEQDIITMPTVIVCDDPVNQNTVPDVPVASTSALKPILPKPKEKPETLSNYVTLYKCDESDEEIKAKAPPTPKVKKQTKKRKLARKPMMAKLEIRITEPSPDPKPAPEENLESKVKTPQEMKPARTPKSGNRSHVRALDFKFHTPPKEVITVKSYSSSPNKTQSSKVKTAKSLFNTPSKQMTKIETVKQKGPLWDTELRALIKSPPRTVNPVVTPAPKRVRKTPLRSKPSAKKVPPSTDIKVENEVGNECEDDMPSKRTRSKGKTKVDECTDGNGKNSEVTDSIVPSSVVKEETNDNEVYQESQITLINCNSKPRYKKKCNMEKPKNDVKVLAARDMKMELAVVLTNDILIPTPNLNTIIEIEDECDQSKLTPDFAKPKTSLPVTAKKNLIPTLETPVKENCVKTPGYCSPVNTYDTPITKVFKEQMEGIDISSIPTPNFMITPQFPITPFIDSPASNRPTDYSTSSSYYQPSDTEQNKSLERVILKECVLQENNKKQMPAMDEQQPVTVEPAVADTAHKAIADKMKQLCKNVIGRKNLNLMKEHSSPEKSSSDVSSSASSSSASSSFSSDSSAEDSDDVEPTAQKISTYSLRSKQVKCNNEELSEPPHSSGEAAVKNIVDTVEFKPVLEKPVNKAPTVLTSYETKVLLEMEEKKKRTIAKLKCESLQTLPVSKKKPTKPSKPRQPPKTGVEKPKQAKQVVPKTKTVDPKVPVKKRATTTRAPKKPPVRARNVKQTPLQQTKPSLKEDLNLTISDNEIEPLEVVETELLCSSNSTTPAPTSDPNFQQATSFESALKILNAGVEAGTPEKDAETLVKGLKKWGIHLVHNPANKKNDDVKNETGDDKIFPKIRKTYSGKPITKGENKKQNTITPKINKSKCNEVVEKEKRHMGKVGDAQQPDKTVNTNEIKDIEVKTVPLKETEVKTSNLNVCKELEEGEVSSGNEFQDDQNTKHLEQKKPTQRLLLKPPLKISKQEGRRTSKSSRGSHDSHIRRNSHEKRTNSDVGDKSKRGALNKVDSEPKVDDKRTNVKPLCAENLTPKSVGVSETDCTKPWNDSDGSEIKFDVKTIDTETLCLIYNENNPTHRIITYDKNVLNKSFKATVFMDTLDKDVDIDMKVTDFECVLDIESKIDLHQKPNITILGDLLITKGKEAKPLELFNNLLDQQSGVSSKSKIETRSPLDDLYPKGSTSYGQERTGPIKQRGETLTKRKYSDKDGKKLPPIYTSSDEEVKDNRKRETKDVSKRRASREARSDSLTRSAKPSTSVESKDSLQERDAFSKKHQEERPSTAKKKCEGAQERPSVKARRVSGSRKSRDAKEDTCKKDESRVTTVDLHNKSDASKLKASEVLLGQKDEYSNSSKICEWKKNISNCFTKDYTLCSDEQNKSDQKTDIIKRETGKVVSVTEINEAMQLEERKVIDDTKKAAVKQNEKCVSSSKQNSLEHSLDAGSGGSSSAVHYDKKSIGGDGIEEDPEVFDDLMNFTLTLKQDDDKSGTKRPADNDEIQPDAKKHKPDNCKELLEKLDVEVFLKQLHGE